MYHKLDLSTANASWRSESRGQTSLPPSALGVGRSALDVPLSPVPSGYPSFRVRHLLCKEGMLILQILRAFLYGLRRALRGGTWRSLTRVRVPCGAITQPF